MELLRPIENDVLKQKEEETLNVFSTVAEFREFILTTHPNADVSVTLNLCCLSAERLNVGYGTRVTLVDAAQREVFEPTSNALRDLTPIKRKPFLVQVTVWYAKAKKGSFGKPTIEFHPGAVYKFMHVGAFGFYADIAKGSVQFDFDNYYKIAEIEPPLKKRKLSTDVPSLSATRKSQASFLSETNPAENDVVMATESKSDDNHHAVTTRSKRHP